MLNKKAKNRKFFKKNISIILASLMILSSGVALSSLISSPANTTSAYIYSTTLNQTQNLVDENNIIKPEFYMNTKVNIDNKLAKSVDIKLVTPKFNQEDLILRVGVKAEPGKSSFKEYRIDTATQALHLDVDTSNGGASDKITPLKVYEVDVYNKSVTQKNLIGKSEFIVFPKTDNWAEPYTRGYPLVDGKGNPIVDGKGEQVNMWFPKKDSAGWVGEKIIGIINSEKVQFPFDAHSIKVVVFAPEKHPQPQTIDISKCAFSFYHKGHLTQNGAILEYDNLLWAPDTMDSKTHGNQSTKFEFHFYKDNVVEGNFLFKVTGVTLPIE